jgi:hypothetical protein
MAEDAQIEALAHRIGRLEDELAIRDALARYTLSADCGNAAAALFAEDCSVDIDGAYFMNGNKEVCASVDSTAHQKMLPKVAHITGPFHVHLSGAKAVATGYMMLFFKDEAITAGRLSLGHRWCSQ